MPRLAIVEDSPVKARLIKELFGNDRAYEMVGHATTAAAARQIPDWGADIVLVDRMLPDGDGLDLAAELSEAMPAARVYLYSATDPPPLLPGSVGYLRNESIILWPRALREEHAEAPYVRHPRR